jgi:hypothetical protein
MSLGTHYRLPVWLSIVKNSGSHADDFEELVHLVQPALLLCVGRLARGDDEKRTPLLFRRRRVHEIAMK